MLKIYFSVIPHLPPRQAVQNKLLSLPLALQQKITAYKNPWDRLLQLGSKLLLQEIIRQFGLDNEIGLDDLRVSKNNKPYFNNALYFSHAHSGKAAVCAACSTGEVGVDIEEMKPVDLAIYQEYFVDDEWQHINAGSDATKRFFTAWTRKEAVLKASGSDIHENFASVNVLNNSVAFNGAVYYLQPIPVQQGYVCHVACTKPHLKAEVTAITLF